MTRLNVALPRALDINADPVNGGKLYVYEAGTTTPANAYSDSGLSTLHAHPIIADAEGRFAEVYVAEGSYKVVIKDASDATLDEADYVEAYDNTRALYDFESRAAATVGNTGTATTITVRTPAGDTLRYKYDASGTALTTGDSRTWSPDGKPYADHYGENTTPGTTDMATAINACLNDAGDCYLFAAQYAVGSTITHDNCTLMGEGQDGTGKTTLLGLSASLAASAAIVKIGRSMNLERVAIQYDSITGTEAEDERVGIDVRGETYVAQRGSFIDQVFIGTVGTAVSDFAGGMFSVSFGSIEVGVHSYAGFNLRGTERTGNDFGNIYINGGSTYTTCKFGFNLEGQTHGGVIRQLNVEHNAYSMGAVRFKNCHGIELLSLHLEGVDTLGENQGYFVIDGSAVIAGTLNFLNTRANHDGLNLIKLEGGDYKTDQKIEGTYSVASNVCTLTATAHGIATTDSAFVEFTSGGAAALDGVYTVTRVDDDTLSFALTTGDTTGNCIIGGYDTGTTPAGETGSSYLKFHEMHCKGIADPNTGLYPSYPSGRRGISNVSDFQFIGRNAGYTSADFVVEHGNFRYRIYSGRSADLPYYVNPFTLNNTTGNKNSGDNDNIAFIYDAIVKFPTRADIASSVGSVASPSRNYFDGQILTADDGLEFVFTGGGSDITDLNGLAPRDVVTPEHWGAVGDGSTDDTSAIQSALDYLTGLGGGELLLGSKTYACDTQVLIDTSENNITLRGEGALSVLKKGADSSANILRVRGDYFKARDVTFDGDKANNTTDTTLLFVYGDYADIQGCIFRNSPKNGLAFSDDTPTNGDPIHARIINNHFETNDGVGLSTAGLDRFTIGGNTFKGNGLEGLTLDQGTKNGTVTGNVFDKNNLGAYGGGNGIGQIGYDNAENISIIGNHFIGNGTGAGSTEKPGIRQGNALGDSLGMSFTGNTFEDHPVGIDMSGITASISGDNGVQISGNTFRDCPIGIKYTGTGASASTNINIGRNTFASGVTTPIEDNGDWVARLPAGYSAFTVRLNTTPTNVTGNGTAYTVVFDVNLSLNAQEACSLNTGTGQVTVPISGVWQLDAKVDMDGFTAATDGVIEIAINGTVAARNRFEIGSTARQSATITSIEQLNSGDVLTVILTVNGEASDIVLLPAAPLSQEFHGCILY